MLSGCGKAGFAFVLAASALMMSACVSVTSPEQVESNMQNLLDNHADVNEVRVVQKRENAVFSLSATPILAAIVLGPDRVPKLIEEGARVNFVDGTLFSPLGCATYLNVCEETFRGTENSSDYRLGNVLALMNIILENGADPNESIVVMPTHVMKPILCPDTVYGRELEFDDSSVKILRVLIEYGAEFDSEKIAECRKDLSRSLEYLSRSGPYIKLKDWQKKLSKELQKKLMFLNDFEEMGINKALSLWENPDQYFAVAMERKEREEAERKRQQEIAQEKLNAKKQAISFYIASRPDLNQALDEVVQIGSQRKAVDSLISNNGFGRLCETGSNNTFYQSKSCLSEWEVVRRQASSHYSSLDSTYKKQRDWFAGLFGQNASVAAAVVDDRVARTPSDKNVKQQYAPIEQQLIRITESEARAERAESRRREQQQIADFMNHIQSTFDRTNRMLDRNMAQTHRVVNQAYASQRVRDVSTGSGYRVRSAPAMRDLNKELKEIDRSFEVSASSGSGGTKSGAGGGSSGKSAYRVCGGPTTVPAMNQVFDVRGLNSGKASPDYQCPAGGKPVMAGAYNLDTGNISWLSRPPTYKQEPVRGENGRPNGARVSWDAYRYECLCSSSSGSGTRAGGYQQ